MSQHQEPPHLHSGSASSEKGTPSKSAVPESLKKDQEGDERLSTRDTTDKIDSRGRDLLLASALLPAGVSEQPCHQMDIEQAGSGHQLSQRDSLMLVEFPSEVPTNQDQMLKEDIHLEASVEGSGQLPVMDREDVQLGMKKRPGRPPLKKDLGYAGTTAKSKHSAHGLHQSGKQTKGKRAGVVRELPVEPSATRTAAMPGSRNRKDYMNYEEMVASINLLRYLDWDKLNPKNHQNSPFHNPPMVPIALWFMLCAQYFPRLTREQMIQAQQVLQRLPEFGLSGSTTTALYGPAVNQYVPIFCISKVAQCLSVPGPSTIIAPVYLNLSKHMNKPQIVAGEASTGATKPSRKQFMQSTDKSDRKLISTDLNTFLDDRRNEKKFRLQYTLADDIFLSRIRAAVLRVGSSESEMVEEPIDKLKALQERKGTRLEDIIQQLEHELEVQHASTQNSIKNLNRKIEAERNNQLFFEGSFKSEHLLQDLHSNFKEEMKYLDIMEYKQQNQVTCSILDTQQRRNKFSFPEKERPKKSEDYLCQICNDGDYSDENLIVFCSRCNISFHQRCYGIPQIPEGNWICDLCKYHGPEGRFVRCALCTRRGGCLRRTYIPATDEFWKVRNRTYWEFATEGESVKAQEPPEVYSKDGVCAVIDDNISVNSDNFENFLFYDYYQELDKWRPGDEQMEPKTHLAWVHLSCCMWISDLEMTLESAPNKVKNLENLDKLRFNLECGICGKKEGACIQCHNRNCAESFHVECARRTKMFMEARNSENRFFTIYCEKHAPLEAKRKLESSAANCCNLITKFCRHIEKLFESYRPRCLDKPLDEETPYYIRQLKKRIAEKLNMGRQNSKSDDDLSRNPFIKMVRAEVQKYPEYGNVIDIKLDPETGEYLSANYTLPTLSIWKDLICKTHPVWESLSRSQEWCQPLVYKKYKRLMNGSDELPFDHLVKVKIPRSQRNRKRNADYESDEISYVGEEGVFFIQNTEKFDDELYCLCQKPWTGELMIECLKCTKWFHPKCLGIEETDEVKLNQMDVICNVCSGGLTSEVPELEEHPDGVSIGKRSHQPALEESQISNLEKHSANDLQRAQQHGMQTSLDDGEAEHLQNGTNSNLLGTLDEIYRRDSERKLNMQVEPVLNKFHSLQDHKIETVTQNGKDHDLVASAMKVQPKPASLKQTPRSKAEQRIGEPNQRGTPKSSLGHTPTKQANITNYYAPISQSLSKVVQDASAEPQIAENGDAVFKTELLPVQKSDSDCIDDTAAKS